MIALISPSILCFDDTLNTLTYANRVKNIKTTIKKNVIEYGEGKFDELIGAMKKEIEELKNQLHNKSNLQEMENISKKC